MTEVERNAIIVQALLYIPRKTAGIGLNFVDSFYVGSLQGQPSGHDQADIAAAQNDDLFSHHDILQIHIGLGDAGGIDAGGTGARSGQGAAGPFPAPHGQENRLGLDLQEAAFFSDRRNDFFRRYIQHRTVGYDFNFFRLDPIDEALGVFRAGEGFAEAGQAEAVMDTLAENTAGEVLPLQNQNILNAFFPQAKGRSQPRGAAADDYGLPFHACSPPLIQPVNI